jgi:hypothetical protein
MKMTLSTIDDQIREVENRIAVERIALDDGIADCTHSLREALTSPKTLLALLGVGFAVGKVMFRQKPQPQAAPAKKAGALGLLTGVAGTAISLAGSRWMTIAKWAAGRYFGRKKAAAANARNAPPAAAPPAASRHAPSPAAAPSTPPPPPAYSRPPVTTDLTSSPHPASARGL